MNTHLEGCSNIYNVVMAHRKRGSLGLIAAIHVEPDGSRLFLVVVHVVNIAACRAVVATIFFCCDANRVADADIAGADGPVLCARPERVIAGDAHETARPAIHEPAISRSRSRKRSSRVSC